MNTLASRPLAPGFADPIFDSQAAFRSTMEALASPGRVRPVGAGIAPDVPLLRSAAAVILAMCDFETTLFLSAHVANQPGVAEFLRFHTDAPIVPDPGRAAFALVDLKHDGLDLRSFAQGNAEYPDRSTTVIVLCNSLSSGPSLALVGPGIATVASLNIASLSVDFAAQWAANRAAFPLGVDLIFASLGEIVGLPRSTRLIGEHS